MLLYGAVLIVCGTAVVTFLEATLVAVAGRRCPELAMSQ